MTVRIFRILIVLMLVLTAACDADAAGDDIPDQVDFGPPDRRVTLRVPTSYDHATPTPLIVVLHGYGVTGNVQVAFSRLDNVGALVLGPDGTSNERDEQFWSATDQCCDFFDSGVDDVEYIGELIDEVVAVYNVDPKRIFLWGHSNGGFMAYRMACERASDIAGIVSLAGTTFTDSADCSPSEPVSILHIHGTADDVVLFDGGENLLEWAAAYPGVHTTLGFWADYNGCESERTTDDVTIDLDSQVAGAETSIERTNSCPSGIAVELWTMAGSEHIPALRNNVGQQFWEWMQAHPKP